VGLTTAPHARRGVVGVSDPQLPMKTAWRGAGVLGCLLSYNDLVELGGAYLHWPIAI
jgi:hypothetical protein